MTNHSNVPLDALRAPVRARRNAYFSIKRALDILFSLAALILLALPMLLIALLIRCDSPGPALFIQNRIGLDGKLFRICKFRTMYCTAPSDVATGQLDNAKSHITKVGALLRKSSLDELPQLFNVLRGDMSLIGPRPLIPAEEEIHRLRQKAGIYAVRPGMTGWAQVNGRDCISLEDKVACDLEYVSNVSFSFDARIILKTLSTVFSGDGYAEGRASEADSTAVISE